MISILVRIMLTLDTWLFRYFLYVIMLLPLVQFLQGTQHCLLLVQQRRGAAGAFALIFHWSTSLLRTLAGSLHSFAIDELV